MAEAKRALVAEDDEHLTSLLARALTSRGWTVDTVLRGDAAVRSAEGTAYEAILLDVMLPGLNGFEVCRRLRDAGNDASILMLTARGTVDDRVEGLSSGADDYLVKPFALRELHARLEAIARRRAPGAPAAERIAVGQLELLPGALQVRVGDDCVELRRKECDVLAELLARPGQYVTKYDLLESCWNGALDQQSNVVETTIRRLRAKLRPLPSGVVIETVRGVGYRIVEAR
jgi:two-component system OmpR family response regulator